MTAAARPIPLPGCRADPRSATGVVTGRAAQPWRCARGPRRSPRPTRAPRPNGRVRSRMGQTGPVGLADGLGRSAGAAWADAAEHVQPVQRRRPLNDLSETHDLTRRVQAGNADQDGDPGPAGQAAGRGRAEQRAQGVGAGVPQHGPLTQVLREQRHGRPDRRHGTAAPAPSRRTTNGQRRPGASWLIPSGTPAARATLRARPGRRSNRFIRFADPATRAALIATSTAGPPCSTAAATPVAPMPPIFTAPVVTWPCARAPRWPRNPRRSPDPAMSS